MQWLTRQLFLPGPRFGFRGFCIPLLSERPATPASTDVESGCLKAHTSPWFLRRCRMKAKNALRGENLAHPFVKLINPPAQHSTTGSLLLKKLKAKIREITCQKKAQRLPVYCLVHISSVCPPLSWEKAHNGNITLLDSWERMAAFNTLSLLVVYFQMQFNKTYYVFTTRIHAKVK